jgi:uncharacterized protein
MTKTASDLKNSGWSADEMKKYRPWHSIETINKDKDILEHRTHALKISKKITRVLKEEFGAKRVVLFGSLADDVWFTKRSDIDIYAEGLSAETFFRAESEIQKLCEGFKIDLVEPDECSPELLARINQEGKSL